MQDCFLDAALLLGGIFTSSGQDIHSFFAAAQPLVLNPAPAGAHYSKETTLNYRHQWSSPGALYKTTTAGCSSRMTHRKRNATNTLARGVQAINGRAGDPGIMTNSIALVLADPIQISSDSKIGAGITFAVAQRTLRPAEKQWTTQYNGSSFDISPGNGETFEHLDFRFADASLGFVYTHVMCHFTETP